MKRICAALSVLCCLSCGTRQNIIHEGKDRSEALDVTVDTVYVDVPESGGYGNFYMTETVITFADEMTYRFYDMDLSGNIIREYFRKGRVWLAKNFMVDPGGPSVDADPDDQFHSTCFCSARSRSD